jgi:hypothetical protein
VCDECGEGKKGTNSYLEGGKSKKRKVTVEYEVEWVVEWVVEVR